MDKPGKTCIYVSVKFIVLFKLLVSALCKASACIKHCWGRALCAALLRVHCILLTIKTAGGRNFHLNQEIRNITHFVKHLGKRYNQRPDFQQAKNGSNWHLCHRGDGRVPENASQPWLLPLSPSQSQGTALKHWVFCCCWDQGNSLGKTLLSGCSSQLAKHARETGRSGNAKGTFMGASLQCPCWEDKMHECTHLCMYAGRYSCLQRGFCLLQFSIKYYSIIETMLRGYSRYFYFYL